MSTHRGRLDPVPMLGISHSAASRALLLIGAVALLACTPPTAPAPLDARPPLRSFWTITLPAQSEEILIARVLGRDTTAQRLPNVLEVGGRVVTMRRDTLILQPYYLTTRTAQERGESTTIFRGASMNMPDVVFIPLTPNVSVREFRTPVTSRRRPIFPLVLHSLFLLSLFATDVAIVLSF